ncbi:DUF6701 domain-containing protein, partial [Vibrio crassostreae]|uniref:DUF6701 domain-containing protein n=1 Tax=Vibrio crassostreae TaxID=246167 RepID=UPI00321FBD66
SLDINNAGRVIIPDGEKVIIHIGKVNLSNNDSFFGEEGDGQLVVFIHALQNSTVNFANRSEFRGLLYSEVDVIMSNQSTVYGAVTAKAISLRNTSKIIATDNHCFQPSDDYEIDISPATDLALMCGDDSPQFTINTSNNGVAGSLGVTVSITPDADEFDVSVLQGQGSGTYPNYVSNDDGELTLKVVAKDTANIDFDTGYKLTATLVDDSGKEVESQFKFVPFKFSLVDGDSPTNRLDVIAGQATPTVTKVLACDLGDSIVVAENYVGEAEKQVTITHELDNSWNGSDGTLTYLPEFKKGSAATDLAISESGLFNVTLKDSSFDCTGFAGCPDDGSYDLEGSFSIYSRPWQFAICTDNNSDGNSSSGSAFVAAGEAFDVYARPIKYTNSYSVCGDDNLLTYNYFKSTASVEVTTTLDTPLITVYPDAKLGDLTPETQLIKQISSNDQSNKGYKFESLKYSEVGSFNFVATETGSFYGSILGGFSGIKSIGRFYPKYFKVYLDETVFPPLVTDWLYPSSQNFTYMNQPFGVDEFYVEALNENRDSVKNYVYFHSDLQADLVLDQIDSNGLFSGRFVAANQLTGSWPGKAGTARLVNGKSVGKFSHSIGSTCSSSLCWSKKIAAQKYEDGPFNLNEVGQDTSISIAAPISTGSNEDPIAFFNLDDQRLDVQPDIRFGRIDLDDVGGNSGSTIAIPLRAEYWNGSRFVLNEDDNATNVEASTSASDVVWSEDGGVTTTVTFDNGGQVSGGESRNLTASQGDDVSIREQVQLWQNMDDIPWLRYDWDSDKVSDEVNGEQDPSTVVTFGIYRGNDRVIYRGESGLTGQ